MGQRVRLKKNRDSVKGYAVKKKAGNSSNKQTLSNNQRNVANKNRKKVKRKTKKR